MWKDIKNFLNKTFNVSIESVNQTKITPPQTTIIPETLAVKEEFPQQTKQHCKRKTFSNTNETKSVIKSLKKNNIK